MPDGEVPEIKDPFVEDPVEHPEEDEEPGEAGGYRFAAQVAELATDMEKLADVQLTDKLVQQVIEAGRTAAQNPLEALRDPTKTSQRLDNLDQRRDQALAKISETSVRDAHASFLDVMFGLDVKGQDSEGRRKAADTLLTHLVYGVQGKPLPATMSSESSSSVQELARRFKGITELDYWMTLANAYDGDPVKLADLNEHMVFMGITGQMTPLDRPFVWADANAVAWQVDQLIAASGANPVRPAGSATGSVDIAEIYRRAASLRYNGKPVPRSVVAELVRLALGELITGVRPSPRTVLTPGREPVLRALEPEAPPSGADPKTTADIASRNRTRAAATDLLKLTARDTAGAGQPTGKATAAGTRSAEALRTMSRAGRNALGDLLRHQTNILSNAIRRSSGGSSIASTFEGLLKTADLATALDTWSSRYRSLNVDPAQLADTLADLKVRMKAVIDGLDVFSDPLKNPGDASAQTIREILSAIALEVGFEANELLLGGVIDTGTRLGGAIAAVDGTGLQGRSRKAAALARDGAGGLGEFVTDYLKTYTKAPWGAELKAAADAWSAADQKDMASLAKQTPLFVTAIEGVEQRMKTLTGEQRFMAQTTVDALCHAVRERLLGTIATGNPDALLGQFPQLAAQLEGHFTTFESVTDLPSYWSRVKNAISGTPPDGLAFGDRLGAWQKVAFGQPPIDPPALAAVTYPVVEAVVDYRVKIEQGKNTPADKAELLRLLDTILATMEGRMVQIAGVNPLRTAPSTAFS
jgi:hypothetical protein